MIDLALKLKDIVDSRTTKKRVLLRKFLEEFIFKKLNPYLKYNIQSGKASNAARVWPESIKDKDIKEKIAEKKRKEEEERKKDEERKRVEQELE